MADHATIGRRNKATGRSAEEAVALRLSLLGAQFVQRIETGFKVIRRPIPGKPGQTQIVGAVPIRKVCGDLRAIGRGGQSLLVEVKRTSVPKLSLKVFADHQVSALETHHACGGLSIVGWVIDAGCCLLRWPISDLAHKRPLSWDRALLLSMRNLQSTPTVADHTGRG